MAREKIVSWRTLVLFILFPPAAVIAIVGFPVTLAVVFWLYYRGQTKTELEKFDSEATELAPEK